VAQLHDAFTVPFAGTGIEIHGDKGSVFGRNVMTQKPVGEVLLRDAQGERAVPVEHESLYARGVARFCAALRGEGEPAATALDGVRSLATALAIAEACQGGKTVRVAPLQP
jgi:1,5-anhydro-D-fructose reductase (1,5-anhydro-D-mannitol-forming)